jgi:Putative MetA-pathway of phenol degradation
LLSAVTGSDVFRNTLSSRAGASWRDVEPKSSMLGDRCVWKSVRRAPRRPLASVIAVAVVALLGRPAGAQQALDPHAVQPERPTVATHAGTVAPGWVEIEAGGELDRYADGTRGATAPVLVKIGLATHLQLSVSGSLVSGPGPAGGAGIGDAAVGVKWRLIDHLPLLGRFAIEPAVKLPTGSPALGTGTGTTDASLLLISSHDLGPVELDINVGYTRRSGDGTAAPRNATVWTTSFGGPAAGNLGWAAELYGYPATSGPAGSKSIVALLLGPTLLPRAWLAFDAGAIVPLTGPQPRAWYFGGVWNIGRLK